jgi:hypothetical protein
MSILTYELSKIHNTYKRLRYAALVPCGCEVCVDSPDPHFYDLNVLKKFSDDNQLIQCQKSYKMVDATSMLKDMVGYRILNKEIADAENNKTINFQGATIQQLVLQQSDKGELTIKQANKGKDEKTKDKANIRSAWANGLFYLFVFVTVIAGLGVLANSVPWYTFALILVASVIFVPLIGALQLRQDKNLSEKGFLELISIVIRQLPIIERLYKNK